MRALFIRIPIFIDNLHLSQGTIFKCPLRGHAELLIISLDLFLEEKFCKKTKMLIQIWFQPIESENQDLSKYLLKRLKIPNFLCNLLTSVTSLTGSAYLA